LALNIQSAETDRLARELAARTGESVTEAVTIAPRERLARRSLGALGSDEALLRAKLRAIFCKAPVLDPRSPDAIIGDYQANTID
jgi:antitoxin VapB